MALFRPAQPLRVLAGSLRAPAQSAAPSRAAAFHMSAARAAKDDEEHARQVEREKQDQLRKQQQGKGHWKEELASDSEDAVKAERNETHEDADNTKKMQEQTAEKPREKHGQ